MEQSRLTDTGIQFVIIDEWKSITLFSEMEKMIRIESCVKYKE